MRWSRLAGAAFALVAGALSLPAQRPGAGNEADQQLVRERYAKTEVYITMRDGVRLFTQIYAPRDTARRYPFLMTRTPYSVAPYGADAYRASLGPASGYADDGFIFVYQDSRGRFMSEGYFQYMTPNLGPKRGPRDTDESTDTYDTIDWLIKNIAHGNGRVGTYGTSAPGFLIAAGMIDAHPAHKAASPQAPLVDWYFGDDRHHNGALTLAQSFNFLMGFARGREGPTQNYGPPPVWARENPDGYRFFLDMGPTRNANTKYFKGTRAFWDSMMVHDSYDAFWQKRSLARHLKHITPAVLLVGGWYDGEDLYGPLEANRAMDTLSAETDRHLVFGPWAHGAWNRVDGDQFGWLRFPEKTGIFYRDSVQFPFFRCHLKEIDCDQLSLPRALVYQTGVNQWRRFDAWPPREARTREIYLREGNALAFAPSSAAAGSDSYVSDPAKPVPYTAATSFGYFRDYPTEDQRFAASRPDVLVYETAPLTEPLTMAGPIEVTLHVATTGTDADFIAKVIDVWPSDTQDPEGMPSGMHMALAQQLVRGDVMRAKFRNSFSKPEALTPGKPAVVKFRLQDVFHTWKPGHRLMIQVQSTWFPLIDRNPQTFTKINEAGPEAFRKATMTIYRSKAMPSHISVKVMP